MPKTALSKDGSIKNLIISPKVTKDILMIGIPSSLSMLIMAMGSFIFNLILNNPFAVAAFQTASRIEHLFFLPVISISSSMVTLVGMFFGAERFDLIKEIVKYGLKSGILFSCLCATFFYFTASHIIPFFTNSIEKSVFTINIKQIIIFLNVNIFFQ